MQTNQPKKQARKPTPKFAPEELDSHTLLLTRGGSHLYGLNHAGSDEDFYRVMPEEHYWKAIGKRPSGNPKVLANQTIINGIDQMIVSEKTFHIFCFEGVPQSLEAMFSQQSIIDKIPAFRNDYFGGLNLDHMCGRYMRTIKAFAYGDFKKRRHSLRLSLNLREAQDLRGRFNPTLNAEQIEQITRIAGSTPKEFIEALTEINYFTIDENWNWAEIEENFAQ